jgi:hypothetical protein
MGNTLLLNKDIRYRLLCIFLISGMLFSSCDPGKDISNKIIGKIVNLKVYSADIGSGNEDNVNNLIVLLFEPNGGVFLGYMLSQNVENGMVALNLPEGIDKSKVCDALVIANFLSDGYSFLNGMGVDEYIRKQCTSKSKNQVSELFGILLPTNGMQPDNLLLRGGCDNTPLEEMEFRLGASLAKLFVKINEFVENFEGESAWVYNLPRKVLPWSNSYLYSSNSDEKYNLSKEYHFVDHKLTEPIYLVPTLAEYDQAIDKTAYLIVKGRYNGGQASFYRVDILFNEHLKTPIIYGGMNATLLIESVNAVGYASIKDAIESSNSQKIEASIY